MKMRYLAWLVPPVIFLAVYAAGSENWRHRWAVLTGAAPVLECPTSLDLGEQEQGKVAIARFTVANRGGRELVIDEIQISAHCGCSGLEQEKEGQFVRVESLRVGPNQQADLAIRIRVQGAHGSPMRNSVRFRTNDAARPQAAVAVHVSQVRAGVSALPTLAFFGTMPVGGNASQVLDIFDGAVQSRKIDRVVSSNPERVAVRLLPLEGILPESIGTPGTLIGRIEVTALAREQGPLDGKVAIHLTGEDQPTTLIPFSGRVAAPVEVMPALLVLPRATEAGPVYFGKCLCRSTDKKPLVLTVDSVPKGVTVQVEAIEGVPSQLLIRIEWHPAQDSDPNQGMPRTIRLRARVGDQDIPLEIPVTCLREGGR